MRKRLSKATGAFAAGLMVIGLQGPAMAETSGDQNFLVVNTSPYGGQVTAVGVLTATGEVVVPQGQGPAPFPVELIFDQGTLFLTIIPSHDTLAFNDRSCMLSGSIWGAYEVTGGTNEFAGASGGGSFRGRVVLVFGRDPGGQCIGPDAGPPEHGIQVIRNPGTLSLPAYGD